MSEHRFFTAGERPFYTDPAWYATIARAPHLEEAGHVERLGAAALLVGGAVGLGAASVCDLGAGDGGLLSLIDDIGRPAWGYDLIPANVEAAVNERHVAVSLRNFETDSVQYGECVVLTEVLEHLVDPHGVLRDLPPVVRFVVASSPDGETEECHYPHHTYGWDQAGFRAMFDRAGWRVLRHDTVPGFQLLLASR